MGARALAVGLALLAGGCAAEPGGEAAVTPATEAPPSPSTTVNGSPTTIYPLTTSAPTAPTNQAGRDVSVERVVDGDTIVVSDGERVRLIGIDTPETVDPRKPVQCFGREASDRTKELLPAGTAMRLVSDVEPTDRYGRTLAYVYRADDGLFVNAALVADGYALTATYPPNVAHAEELAALASQAREEGRGLWSAPCADEPPAPEPAPVAPQPVAGDGAGCDPAYPDACIPPAPPDLDCGQIAERRFQVRPPDPHGFDRDRDGIGCES
jgi:micrococcal nuclease